MFTGAHVAERNEKYSGDLMKLMNSQSQAYVTYKRQKEIKTVDKLQSNLHLIGSGESADNSHTIFMDSKEEGNILYI